MRYRNSEEKTPKRSHRVNWAKVVVINLVFVAVALELGAFVSFQIDPHKFFSHEQYTFRRIEKVDGQLFLSGVAKIDPILGWTGPLDRTRTIHDCTYDDHPASYDTNGARRYPGYDKRLASILLIGDSYTQGDEVSDSDTISGVLKRKYDLNTINLGVNGYGPYQAILKYRDRARHYPEVRIVVLGIMYEMIFRMANSYQPAYYSTTSSVFGFKPYFHNGSEHAMPEIPTEMPGFKNLVRQTIANDYWAKPKAKFPFSVAFLRSLSSNLILHNVQGTIGRFSGAEYRDAYMQSSLGQDLLRLLKLFEREARSKGHIPIVYFIPRNGKDTSTPENWIEKHRQALGSLVVRNVSGNIDWRKYNQKPNRCHPSEYGYEKIADGLAELLRTYELDRTVLQHRSKEDVETHQAMHSPSMQGVTNQF